MKVLIINGSPKKNGTTATLLNNAVEGVVSQGVETELINLYDLNYKGCLCCLSCKNPNGNSYGKCAIKDELTPVFEKIVEADAVIIGSPIYCGSITGAAKSFFERLTIPYISSGSFKKVTYTGFIFTMGTIDRKIKEAGYDLYFKNIENLTNVRSSAVEALYITDTNPLRDNYKPHSADGNIEDSVKKRKIEFLMDCQKAFDLGAKFAEHLKINNN